MWLCVWEQVTSPFPSPLNLLGHSRIWLFALSHLSTLKEGFLVYPNMLELEGCAGMGYVLDLPCANKLTL